MALVTPRFYPFTGGVETHVQEIARRLPARRVVPEVLTTDPGRKLTAHERWGDVDVIRVPAYPRGSDYHWAPGIWHRLMTSDFDVIHCQGIHTFVPIHAMAAAIRRHVPFVVTFHTGGHPSWVRSRLRAAQWRLLSPMLLRASRLIAVSRFERDLFSRLPGLRPLLTVIPNGADLVMPSGGEAEVDRNLIVSVGRLEKYKGHHRAIAALPYLIPRRPRIRLKIVGAGRYEAALRREAQKVGVHDRVEIGPIDPSDRQALATLLASAGAVVLLSDYEAHAIAALEALSTGRPVVVSDATGLHDLVAAGLARGVRPTATPRDVAAAIEEEVARPSRRSEGLPSWDAAADALADVYRSAARK